MKKNFLTSVAFALVLGLAACGDDSSTSSPATKLPTEVKDLKELEEHKCDMSVIGEKVFVESEDLLYECDGDAWFKSYDQTKPSSTSTKSSSSKKSDGSSDSKNSDKDGSSSSDATASSSSAKSSSSRPTEILEPEITVNETCTEVGACDAMVKTDVSTWHFVRKDAFGDDAEYTYTVVGKDLIVTIKNADGSKNSKTYSMYNMESEVGMEMAFNAAKATCEDGGGNDVVTKTCVQDTVYSSVGIKYGSLLDERDGQVYKTVTIGTQTWMAENLNYRYVGVKHNYNGYTSDSTSWCYDNKASNCDKYGRLYTWSAVMDSAAQFSVNAGTRCGYGKTCTPNSPHRGICPEGWHVPTDEEYSTLYTYIGGSGTAGSLLKSTSGWNEYKGKSGNGTDKYGFSVLPVSIRDDLGNFYSEGNRAYLWTAAEYDRYSASYHYFGYNFDGARQDLDDKYYGRSLRCLKD